MYMYYMAAPVRHAENEYHCLPDHERRPPPARLIFIFVRSAISRCRLPSGLTVDRPTDRRADGRAGGPHADFNATLRRRRPLSAWRTDWQCSGRPGERADQPLFPRSFSQHNGRISTSISTAECAVHATCGKVLNEEISGDSGRGERLPSCYLLSPSLSLPLSLSLSLEQPQSQFQSNTDI